MQVSFSPSAPEVTIPESWDRLELVDAWTLLAFRDGQFAELATVRWKMSRSGDGASPQYCAAFFPGLPDYRVGYRVGYAKAGGYGYHKASAAFEFACRSAGVTFDQNVGGCGYSAVHDALMAIGRFIVGDGVPLTVVEA